MLIKNHWLTFQELKFAPRYWLTGASPLNWWCSVRKLNLFQPKTFTKAYTSNPISDLLAKDQVCPISSGSRLRALEQKIQTWWTVSLKAHAPLGRGRRRTTNLNRCIHGAECAVSNMHAMAWAIIRMSRSEPHTGDVYRRFIYRHEMIP